MPLASHKASFLKAFPHHRKSHNKDSSQHCRSTLSLAGIPNTCIVGVLQRPTREPSNQQLPFLADPGTSHVDYSAVLLNETESFISRALKQETMNGGTQVSDGADATDEPYSPTTREFGSPLRATADGSIISQKIREGAMPRPGSEKRRSYDGNAASSKPSHDHVVPAVQVPADAVAETYDIDTDTSAKRQKTSRPPETGAVTNSYERSYLKRHLPSNVSDLTYDGGSKVPATATGLDASAAQTSASRPSLMSALAMGGSNDFKPPRNPPGGMEQLPTSPSAYIQDRFAYLASRTMSSDATARSDFLASRSMSSGATSASFDHYRNENAHGFPQYPQESTFSLSLGDRYRINNEFPNVNTSILQLQIERQREMHIRKLLEEEKRCQLELQIVQAQQELKQAIARNRAKAGYQLATRMAAQQASAYPAGNPLALARSVLPASAASLTSANAGTPSTYPGGHSTLRDESIDGIPYYRRNILTMAHHFDTEFLSPQMCFVRRECLEVFVASERDVNERRYPGKVVANQAGIRCRFCAHLDSSQRGLRSTAFPSSAEKIYKSVTMMLRDHFAHCPHMPPLLKHELNRQRRKVCQGSKRSTMHWMQSASDIGLYDTFDSTMAMMALGPPTRHQIIHKAVSDTAVLAPSSAAAAATTASSGASY